MAKTDNPTKSNDSEITSLLDDYQNDLENMSTIFESFDDKERILMSKPIDQISNIETASNVSDPTLLSSVLKQNNQEMAQMPSGKVIALTKQNKGKSLMMDLMLHEHILYHANMQYDPYTKFWLTSLLRKVYGSIGCLVDFVDKTQGGEKPNGYIGPDFSIIPARGLIPQSGKTTIQDSDYAWIRSTVSKQFLESRDPDVWKDISKVLDSGPDSNNDINSQSQNEREYDTNKEKPGLFELVSRYEGDRWRTFHVKSKTEIRDLSKNATELPIVMCHSYPLLDRFIGLGDFERGMTLHAAISSLINLYLDGVKMSIFPPLQVDPATVDNWDDFEDGLGPAQIWLMNKDNFNGLKHFNVSPSGMQSFQYTYGFLKAAILTVTGTSDTTISATTDPAFGRTPQALKMQAFTQGMQAQFGRRMLEISVEKIMNQMIDLTARNQEAPMKLYLKSADLKQVADAFPDATEMFEVGDMGTLEIKPQDIKDVEYRYEIDQGSTLKTDQAQENKSLTEILGFIGKLPGAFESLAQDGMINIGNNKQLDLGELIKRWIITTGITDGNKIIIENEQGENVLNLEDPRVKEIIAQIQSGQIPQNQPGEQDPNQMQPGQPQQPQEQFVPQGVPISPTGEIGDEQIMEVLNHLSQLSEGNLQ